MPAEKTALLRDYVARAPVIPVVSIEDPATAVPLARALVDAGLPVVEITLRTDRALEAMRLIARNVPDAIVVAGTVIAPSQIAEVAEAGAKAIVTPGTPPRLGEALASASLPVMPGCASVSEAMMLSDMGFSVLKFFPAAASGGTAWLRAISGPLPHLGFCPTGGVDASNAAEFLALPNVVCVGGSWVAPAGLIAARDVAAIGRLSAAAARLRPPRHA